MHPICGNIVMARFLGYHLRSLSDLRGSNRTWRGHSCPQRRDSSRRFLGMQVLQICHQAAAPERIAVKAVTRAEDGAWSKAGGTKRRDESRRCGHKCPRHV
jgi:hypothetical protein